MYQQLQLPNSLSEVANMKNKFFYPFQVMLSSELLRRICGELHWRKSRCTTLPSSAKGVVMYSHLWWTCWKTRRSKSTCFTITTPGTEGELNPEITSSWEEEGVRKSTTLPIYDICLWAINILTVLKKTLHPRGGCLGDEERKGSPEKKDYHPPYSEEKKKLKTKPYQVDDDFIQSLTEKQTEKLKGQCLQPTKTKKSVSSPVNPSNYTSTSCTRWPSG